MFWQELLIDYLCDVLAFAHGDGRDARQGFAVAAETMGGIADDEDPGLRMTSISRRKRAAVMPQTHLQ